MISLAITLALVAPALSAPFVNVARQTCMGQSCVIADLSGSTGTPYTGNGPVANSTDAGDCCIIQYNPSATAEIEKLNPGLTCPATKRELGIPQLATSDNLEKRACTPYTLIFSRGTSEPGTLGIVVGPSLSADLEALDPGQWTIIGVAYDASDAGDACLGLPGGAIATQDIDAAAAACPDTKIVVSGYSQGAAVSHIGVANASPSAVKQVAVSSPDCHLCFRVAFVSLASVMLIHV